MRILKFEKFINLNEASAGLKSELIGDSSVGLYKTLTNLIGVNHPELNAVGLNTYGLLKKVKGYSKVDPSVGLVFIGIGSNDGYIVNPSIIATASSLKNELHRIFPNAEFVVVKGGWGWGGLSKFNSVAEPSELENYYKKVWEDNGFSVMDRSQGFSSEHHTPDNQEIRKQVADMESIIRGNKDLFKIGSMLASSHMPSAEDIDQFYDALENTVNSRTTLKQQENGTYLYDPVLQRVQIALEFLGKDLPQFGADGLYGPETAASIAEFKRDAGLDGDGSVLTPQDMISLVGALRDNEFSPEALAAVWKKSEEMASDIDIMGDTDYLFYLQHQQGQSGAASLLKASQGQGKLHPSTRANSGKYLTGNISDKDVAAQIEAAIDANDDQRAATLFLNYWKKFWDAKKKRALSLINQPAYSEIKNAIDSVSTYLPKDFLYTVAFIESGLQAKPSASGRYQGLFAITQENLKKKVPNGDIYNPKDNAFAAIKGMEEGIKTFTNLAGNFLKGAGASEFMA